MFINPHNMMVRPQVAKPSFEYLWVKCAGRVLLSYLRFSELIRLSKVFPVICDSLFHGSTITKQFMQQYWHRFIIQQQDYVQTHDCYEQLYEPFIQWNMIPSASILTIEDGLYPYEPYLAWRLASIFAHSYHSWIDIGLYPNLPLESTVPILFVKNQLNFINIDHVDDEIIIDNETEPHEVMANQTGQFQSITLLELVAFLFEVLMGSYVYLELNQSDFDCDISTEKSTVGPPFWTAIQPSANQRLNMIVSPHSKHTIQQESDTLVILPNKKT